MSNTKKVIITVVSLSVIGILVLRFVMIGFYKLPSATMENTIARGSRIVSWNIVTEPERFSIMVYHSPDNDTATIPNEAQGYYAMVCDYGREYVVENYAIYPVPLKDREFRVGRIVGLPGDLIELKKSKLLVNNMEYTNPNSLRLYSFTNTANKRLSPRVLERNGIKNEDVNQAGAVVTAYVTEVQKELLDNMLKSEHTTKFSIGNSESLMVFPHSKNYSWTTDDFGQILIPQKRNSN